MFKGEYIRIDTPNTTHLYEIEVNKGDVHGSIDVEANNRMQAARLTQKAGYEVMSVNMVG